MRKYITLNVDVPSSHEITIKLPEEVPVGPAVISISVAPERRDAGVTRRDPASIRAAIAEMKEFRKGRKLHGLSIREMIEDGRASDGGR